MIRKKVIFNGVLEATPKDILKESKLFYAENFIYDFDIGFERVKVRNKNQDFLIVNQDNKEKRILNGYLNITYHDPKSRLKIVSCRYELDILYFMLSQRLQAKFVIPEFPAETFLIPFKDLIEKQIIVTEDISMEEYLSRNLKPDLESPRFGKDRNFTKKEVLTKVKELIDFQNRGGTIRGFYVKQVDNYLYSIDTLKYWKKKYKNELYSN